MSVPINELAADYMHQPHEVSIETQSICNASCTFCPYPTLERIGDKMADETIYRLIDEMSEWKKPFFFSPFKVSDPLLDKRLYKILKYFNEKCPESATRIFTNGSALTHKKMEELNDIDRVELWISLNEHRRDKYKPLMGLDYDKVVGNIDALHDSDFRHPVYVLGVGVDNEFVYFVHFRWPDFMPVRLKKDGWLGFTEARDKEVPDRDCRRWYELSIMSSGVVSLCCMDGEGKFPIGNIHENTMLEIYNSPQWKERRENNWSRKQVYPCSTCTY